ncbi:coiled-coil domain-containing protein 117 isoform X1 [Notamacropus eugenii]|uniref:coiled-coil domain-containing protein 117 isoform X1 n=1 Tax=Notamacropus eugenii TaxID=9315 RepID=UPI003B673F26
MAALGRPFPGLPLSLQAPPQPSFHGRPFPGPGGPGPAAPGLAGLRSPASRGRLSVRYRKKHKREEEDESCPLRKKRLTEAVLCASPGDWLLCAHEGTESPGANECRSGLSVSGMFDNLCEEMDQTTGEPQCEAARRRLQEIEDRIIDEDEEVETDRRTSHLPSLVLSDTLKTGLRSGFDEALTKKIIESMSRPSMELVLWKPLPELLPDKPKPSTRAKNYEEQPGGDQRKHSGAGPAFRQQTELFSEPQQMGVPLYSSLDTAGCAEEEMEL